MDPGRIQLFVASSLELPWRRGVVANVFASKTEDGGFESR
jgi:hypothetical protein